MAISEPGCTSREKFPLTGTWLKSTRQRDERRDEADPGFSTRENFMGPRGGGVLFVVSYRTPYIPACFTCCPWCMWWHALARRRATLRRRLHANTFGGRCPRHVRAPMSHPLPPRSDVHVRRRHVPACAAAPLHHGPCTRPAATIAAALGTGDWAARPHPPRAGCLAPDHTSSGAGDTSADSLTARHP